VWLVIEKVKMPWVMRNQYFEKYRIELEKISERVASILGENFLGFYVAGSIVTDAWDPQKSDIDFFVITKRPLGEEENTRIRELHEELSATDLGKKLEGDYVDLDLLRRKSFDRLTGSVKDGKFTPNFPCQISADNILCLVQYGKCIQGTPIEELSLEVNESELKDAVKSMLVEDREEVDKVNDFETLYYLLTDSLRCIYTLETSNLPTKRTAIEHSRNLLGEGLYRDITQFVDDGKEFQIDKTVLKRIMDYGLLRDKSLSSRVNE